MWPGLGDVHDRYGKIGLAIYRLERWFHWRMISLQPFFNSRIPSVNHTTQQKPSQFLELLQIQTKPKSQKPNGIALCVCSCWIALQSKDRIRTRQNRPYNLTTRLEQRQNHEVTYPMEKQLDRKIQREKKTGESKYSLFNKIYVILSSKRISV